MLFGLLRRAGAGLSTGCLIASITVGSASAADPKFIEQVSDWAVYTYKTSGGTVCYIVSEPKDSEPKNVRRDKIFFLVQHRPKDNVRSEVSTIIGYNFKSGSRVNVDIDGQSFNLWTSGDGAWAESNSHDRKLVEAMKSGKSMVVKGTSWRGTKTTDRYSLSGVTAAMSKIDGMCK